MPAIPAFYHYRQHSGAEVDLVVDINNKLLPVEIKAASSVGLRDTLSIRGFQEKVGKRAEPGIIIYAGKRAMRLNELCLAVPFDLQMPS